MKLTNRELEIVTRALRVLSVEIADKYPRQAKEANNIRVSLQNYYEVQQIIYTNLNNYNMKIQFNHQLKMIILTSVAFLKALAQATHSIKQ